MVYSDLRALGIDYANKDDDPHLVRMVNAYVKLAQQFDACSALSRATRDAYSAVLAIAGAHMVGLQPRELAIAVRQVLDVEPVGAADQEALRELRHELGAGYAAYAVRLAPGSASPRPGNPAHQDTPTTAEPGARRWSTSSTSTEG